MGFASQHNQFVRSTLLLQHNVNLPCSNSFITYATDFYGRNDLDMVRISFSVHL